MDEGSEARAPGAVGQAARSPRPVLLYDGECGLCAASVQAMLRHDRKELLLFAPLQGEFAAGVRRRHPGLEQADSMVWVERGNGHERVFIRSDAALRAAAHLGGLWRAAAAVRIVPRPLRDAIYRFIARHRHRFAGGPVCVLPTAAERERFLP